MAFHRAGAGAEADGGHVAGEQFRLLTKTDIATDTEAVEALRKRLAELNPGSAILSPDAPAGSAEGLADYSEAALPGHLRGDDEGAEGYSAGSALPGDKPVTQALGELKRIVSSTTKR